MKLIRMVAVLACATVLPAAAVTTFYVSDAVVLDTEAEPGGVFAAPEARAERPGGAFDGSGNSYLAAWKHQSTDAEPAGYARLQQISASGLPMGDPRLLAGQNPQVAWSPAAARHLVVYDDGVAVKGRRVVADGRADGADLVIGEAAGSWSGYAHAAWGAGRWFVVWYQQGGTIRGRFIGADGVPQGAAFDVSAPGTVFGAAIDDRSFEPPRTAYAAGIWLVVTRTSPTEAAAFRVSDAASAPTGDPILLPSDGFVNGTDVAARPDGIAPAFLVVRRDLLLDFADIDSSHVAVAATFILPSGTVAGSSLPVQHPLPANIGSVVTAAWNPAAAEYHVVYSFEEDATETAGRVLMLRLSPTGTPLADPLALDDSTYPTVSSFPIVVAGNAKQALVLHHPGTIVDIRVYSADPFPSGATEDPPADEDPPVTGGGGGGGGGGCSSAPGGAWIVGLLPLAAAIGRRP